MQKVPLLANDFVTVYESPDPERIYAYTPGLARLPGGRLVATMDQGGPGVRDLPGAKGLRGEGTGAWQGLILTSDDRGQTWTRRAVFPFMHARPFLAGRALYVLGHAGDLAVIRSDDQGETWSEPAYLTQGEAWHQSACSVHYARNKVYLVMEKRARHTHGGWPVSDLAPVLMAAGVHGDLARRESWTWASELVIGDHIQNVPWLGVPFWPPGTRCRGRSAGYGAYRLAGDERRPVRRSRPRLVRPYRSDLSPLDARAHRLDQPGVYRAGRRGGGRLDDHLL